MSKMKDEWFEQYYVGSDLEKYNQQLEEQMENNGQSGNHRSNHPSSIDYNKPWSVGNKPGYKPLPDPKPVDKATKLYPRDVDYDDEFYWNLMDTTDLLVDVMLKKHMDYGPANIANAPGGALNGVAVRLHDKIARLANLLKTGNEPNHESIYDTLLDIANYGIIGMLVFEDKWDKGA
jgi:hypothetical protein